jgi:hypothetical protein
MYVVTMKRPWDVEEVLPMPKKPEKLPVIRGNSGPTST